MIKGVKILLIFAIIQLVKKSKELKQRCKQGAQIKSFWQSGKCRLRYLHTKF